MAGLAVNIDHVAVLREFRDQTTPEPVAAAILAELGGADGIMVHLREDRNHIQDRDVRLLRQVLQTRLILEMVATSEMVGIALDMQPDLVVFTPEVREQGNHTDGLDLIVHSETISETTAVLQKNNIKVAILIDPEPGQVKLAHQINADNIVLHTGTFCADTSQMAQNHNYATIVDAAKLAHKLKLKVSAGCGLDYSSIKAFRDLDEIQEFIIGHSVIARAVLVGMERAVQEIRDMIR
jgi:pyridoxine 5-phosphate synthase